MSILLYRSDEDNRAEPERAEFAFKSNHRQPARAQDRRAHHNDAPHAA